MADETERSGLHHPQALNHSLQTPHSASGQWHLPSASFAGAAITISGRHRQDFSWIGAAIGRGDSLLFTEMVNATSLELGHDYGKMDDLQAEDGPIAVQLFDHRPQAMADAARRAEQAGAFLIDINMGCPVPQNCEERRWLGTHP